MSNILIRGLRKWLLQWKCKASVVDYSCGYPTRTRKVLNRIFNNLRETGNLPRGSIPCEHQLEYGKEVENIFQTVERNPATSLHRMSRQLNIPQTSVQLTLQFHVL